MDTPTFGAIIKEQDPRDYPLGKLGTDIPSSLIPKEYKPDYSKVPVVNQRKQPACGSHAGSTLEGVLSLNKQENTISNSPRFLWKEIKDIDGNPIEAGTDINSIFKVLKDKGVCDDSLAPNNTSLSLEDYCHLKTTTEMYESATGRKIQSYAITYSPTFEQIKESIYKTGAVLILYRCGKNMYIPSWKAKDILPLSPDKYPMDSGHFVVGIGYDKDYIYFRNSWGNEWGLNGDGYFGEDYVKYINAIGTAVDKDKIDWSHTFTHIMTYGEKSNEVVYLQRYLKALGLFNQEPTAYYGDITAKAVYDFQIGNKVAPLDELDALKGKRVGLKTIARLNQFK